MYLYNIDKETVLIFQPLDWGSVFGPDSFFSDEKDSKLSG